jgi:hypothetical protein
MGNYQTTPTSDNILESIGKIMGGGGDLSETINFSRSSASEFSLDVNSLRNDLSETENIKVQPRRIRYDATKLNNIIGGFNDSENEFKELKNIIMKNSVRQDLDLSATSPNPVFTENISATSPDNVQSGGCGCTTKKPVPPIIPQSGGCGCSKKPVPPIIPQSGGCGCSKKPVPPVIPQSGGCGCSNPVPIIPKNKVELSATSPEHSSELMNKVQSGGNDDNKDETSSSDKKEKKDEKKKKKDVKKESSDEETEEDKEDEKEESEEKDEKEDEDDDDDDKDEEEKDEDDEEKEENSEEEQEGGKKRKTRRKHPKYEETEDEVRMNKKHDINSSENVENAFYGSESASDYYNTFKNRSYFD